MRRGRRHPFIREALSLTRIHVAGVAPVELHVFDGKARSDQLHVVLNRLRQVRASAVRQGADH